MCADSYGVSPHTSRGGWTWYTGAAGWMYRLTVETLLGLHLEADQLRIAPCVPADWPVYTVHYRYRETLYHITVKQVAEPLVQVMHITLDGTVIDESPVIGSNRQQGARPHGLIPLVDDHKEHYVDVVLGATDTCTRVGSLIPSMRIRGVS
jgi:cellobiose phosphorylase